MSVIEMNEETAGMQYGPTHCAGPGSRMLTATRDFGSISLKGLEEAKAGLLIREESKHLMTFDQCLDLLAELPDSYCVLEVNNSRITRYETLYYDTPAFLTFLQHHNGKGNRYKLRIRRYDSSKETYLEVKKKTSKGTTEKSRVRTWWTTAGFTPEQEEFLEAAFPYDYREFFPVVKTVYDRLTLVSTKSPERITLDSNISFLSGQEQKTYPGLVIVEIKHEKGIWASPALSALHTLGIRKRGFSKYCIGVSLLYDRVKHNRFKQNLLLLSKLDSVRCQAC